MQSSIRPPVESAVVFCIFDFHMIGDLLYSMIMPDVAIHRDDAKWSCPD